MMARRENQETVTLRTVKPLFEWHSLQLLRKTFSPIQRQSSISDIVENNP